MFPSHDPGGKARGGNVATEIPWRNLIGSGIGVVGIPPEQFWEMGLQELFIVLEGYIEANRVGEKPLGANELEELMLRYPD